MASQEQREFDKYLKFLTFKVLYGLCRSPSTGEGVLIATCNACRSLCAIKITSKSPSIGALDANRFAHK